MRVSNLTLLNMLNVKLRDFEIVFKEEAGFFGMITNRSANYSLALKRVSHQFEKYGICFMQIQYCDKNKADSNYKALLDNCPDELKEKFESKKDFFMSVFNDCAIIEIDSKSADELLKGNKYIKCLLFHEIGHFIHSGDSYNEDQKDRNNAIMENRVIQRELDADEFAFSLFGEDYYDALKMQNKIIVDYLENEMDPSLIPIAYELKMRVKHIIKLIEDGRRLTN